MSAANAALESQDYATAVNKATQALGKAATIPDGGHAGADLRWDFDRIDTYLKRVKQLQTIDGLQATKITYAEVSA